MKPKIEDLIEFVRNGEKDPVIGETVRMHPDGEELLRQARAVFELLGSGASKKEAPPVSAQESVAFLKADVEAVPDAIDRYAKGGVRSISRMISHASLLSLDSRNIGTLRIWVENDWILVTLETDKESEDSMHRVAGAGNLSVTFSARDESDGSEDEWQHLPIQIESRQLLISMDDRFPAKDGVVRFRVANSSVGTPCRALDVMYVPENGPFQRFQTDSKGVATLKMPAEPGVLRIESDRTEVITVKLRK
jgi:hypothetical protein